MNIYTDIDNLPVMEEIVDLAEFFRVFGDPTRLQILFHLRMVTECGVNELADSLSMQQAAVSHQLKMLRFLRLVSYRKEGRNVFYRLCDHHIDAILRIGMEHIQEGV